MDKVGIARSLFYYYYGDIWENYLKELNIPYIISPVTNKEIMNRGIKISSSEMCLSLKNYFGHIDYLKDKCKYLLVPRVCNYKSSNQSCTNFWALYDIVNNMFDNEIISYNIDLEKGDSLKKGLFKIGKKFNKSNLEIAKAYDKTLRNCLNKRKKLIQENINRLNSKKTKILFVSHPYNTYDALIGKDIINYLNKENVEIIYSDQFNEVEMLKLSSKFSKDLYFKYSKQSVGSIIKCLDKIDGIIFLSSFPCALDSLVNELAIRKLKKPSLNIIIDESEAFTAFETRLESFLDILRRGEYV